MKTVLATLALSASATALTLVPGSPASAYSCPQNPQIWWGAPNASMVNSTNVNLRTGPSTGCASLGYIQPGQNGHSYCWATGKLVNGSSRWVYVHAAHLGRYGWVHAPLLTNYQRVAC